MTNYDSFSMWTLLLIGAFTTIIGFAVVSGFLAHYGYLFWQKGRTVRWQAKRRGDRAKLEAIAAERDAVMSESREITEVLSTK